MVPLWEITTLAGAGGLRSNMRDMLLFLDANLGEPTTALERALRVTHARRTAAGEMAESSVSSASRLGDGSFSRRAVSGNLPAPIRVLDARGLISSIWRCRVPVGSPHRRVESPESRDRK